MHRLKQQQCKNQNNLFRISLNTLQTITLYMYKHICNIEAYNGYDTLFSLFFFDQNLTGSSLYLQGRVYLVIALALFSFCYRNIK